MASIDWSKFYYHENNALLLTVVGVEVFRVFSQYRYNVWFNRGITLIEQGQISLFQGSQVRIHEELGSTKYGIELKHPVIILDSERRTSSGGTLCNGLLDIFQHTAGGYRPWAQVRWNTAAPAALRGLPLSPVFPVPPSPPALPSGDFCTRDGP